MKPVDFLATAEDALKGKTRPRQTNLRRACSSTYYALFHTLCHCCARTLVCSTATRKAWNQAYRCLDHNETKDRCTKRDVISRFPAAIQDFANMFVTMQTKRHGADYDPTGTYYKSAVQVDIDAARAAIADFESVDKKHRRAFAVYIATRKPRS